MAYSYRAFQRSSVAVDQYMSRTLQAEDMFLEVPAAGILLSEVSPDVRYFRFTQRPRRSLRPASTEHTGVIATSLAMWSSQCCVRQRLRRRRRASEPAFGDSRAWGRARPFAVTSGHFDHLHVILKAN